MMPPMRGPFELSLSKTLSSDPLPIPVAVGTSLDEKEPESEAAGSEMVEDDSKSACH